MGDRDGWDEAIDDFAGRMADSFAREIEDQALGGPPSPTARAVDREVLAILGAAPPPVKSREDALRKKRIRKGQRKARRAGRRS